jgi:hypothetical protein
VTHFWASILQLGEHFTAWQAAYSLASSLQLGKQFTARRAVYSSASSLQLGEQFTAWQVGHKLLAEQTTHFSPSSLQTACRAVYTLHLLGKQVMTYLPSSV